MKTLIELLAPAKNAEFGRCAINHGADALYIGAQQFGARAAAGNTVSEIENLVKYAHLYRSKIYTVLNTILYDNELVDVQKLIHQLYNIGVDGLIVQDMGILELDLPPIPLIASTQTHNATIEKVKFLENIGFKRVILARELSLTDIQEIRKQTTVELESFVHGALCVSFSGQCYMSQYVCGRSGNRGTCAQPCRSTYDLIDSQENIIVHHKNLLSTKDLNLSHSIAQMLDAGVTSFKIEGRLKDLDYVKNVVSNYRLELDKILNKSTLYQKSSSGDAKIGFETDLSKSFNRGFTSYFIEGRKEKTGSYSTQKSIGKRVGEISHVGTNWFILQGDELVNGDGICFFDKKEELIGTLIGRVEGERAYPNNMNGIVVGLEIYRNHDHRFEKMILNETAKRKIGVEIILKNTETGLSLEMMDEDSISAIQHIDISLNAAEKPEFANSQTITQLSKLGDTPFEAKKVTIDTTSPFFIPTGILNQLRRDVAKALENKRITDYKPEQIEFRKTSIPYFETKIDYKTNISNRLARQFYERHGVVSMEMAFELSNDRNVNELMITKHCIRYQLDACPIHQKNSKKLENPLFLKDNNRTYRLEFDCKRCVMKVMKE